YALEQELPPVRTCMPSPTEGVETEYTIYPLDMWVNPERHDELQRGVSGVWLAHDGEPDGGELSPTARAVLAAVGKRERDLSYLYAAQPEKALAPDAPRLLLRGTRERPTMEAQARKWLSRNRGGVRHL